MQGKCLSLLLNPLFIIGFLSFYISASYAIYPVNLVYRGDTRNLGEIYAANGMRPWAGSPVDYDLIHHFDGESVEDYTSAFVSTSASFRQSIEHAASLARANSEEPFEEDFRIFIYAIRPESNFYEVEGSIAHARDTSAEHSQRQAGLSALLHNYGGMEEWVALEGLSAERIISFIEITGEMLQNYYQSGQLFSYSFWINRWQPNLRYNSASDGDISSSEFYTHIGNPRGYRDVIQGEIPTPLAASFICITPTPNSIKKRQLQSERCKTRKGRHFYFVNRLITALENSIE
ncbi:hypothetical protein QVN42_09615 [Yersinia nurmii]|uniref:Enterotoxin subunit n=1 Tax=Yersinia nurmii TaxID=685706 RepID=A0AAW7K2C7_9GAMM|nr:hypothetical protein [Yersinia nurmii]MDN0087647.1 hypothetical protein [Yersinia nurmii]